jgi:hypothetical protein
MSVNSQSLLHKQLEELINSASSSVQAELSGSHDVVLERRGHVRGVWHCKGKSFSWTPAGYNEPTFTTANLDAAVAYTRDSILQR